MSSIALAGAYLVLGAFVGPVLIRMVEHEVRLVPSIDPAAPGVPPSRRVLVEVLTSSLFAAMGSRYGDHVAIVPLLVFSALVVVVSVVNYDTLSVSDRLTIGPLLPCTALIVMASVMADVSGAIGGGVVGAAAFFALLLGARSLLGGIGSGVVKLAPLLGLYLGWTCWAPGRGISAVSGVLYALILGCVITIVLGMLRGNVQLLPYAAGLSLASYAVVVFSRDLPL